MQTITTIGLDIAKLVFQVHGVDAEGNVLLRRQLKRRYVLAFFEKLPPCLVGIEACASAHHWSRELQGARPHRSPDVAWLVKTRPPIQAAEPPCLNERTLVFTGPQSAHSKFWSARSRLDGCGSIGACMIGLRHFGQVSLKNKFRDMVSSFRAGRTEGPQRGQT